jgi:hypothetical protein
MSNCETCMYCTYVGPIICCCGMNRSQTHIEIECPDYVHYMARCAHKRIIGYSCEG